MGYKIFMVVCNLLIPLCMFGFGIVFEKHPPRSINMAYGYRTTRSMKSEETWAFAHAYCGSVWRRAGLVMGIVSAAACIAVFLLGEDAISVISIVLITLQIILLIGSLYPVEKALEANFDERGVRRK